MITEDQKTLIKRLATITDGSDDWRSYAYKVMGGNFAVTDGARVMTLDLSDVVPDDVDAFDPQIAITATSSNDPWDRPMSERWVKAGRQRIECLIPRTERYVLVSPLWEPLCEPFFAPKYWGDLATVRGQIRAYLEVPNFSIQKFWRKEYSKEEGYFVQFKLASDKAYQVDHYSVPLDLRLLSPLSGALVTFKPFVGEEERAADVYKQKPIRLNFVLDRGRGRSGELIILPTLAE
jgi:hypothetical protein